ncbi:MAG: molybdate ABC transporter substrate-binding protein [Peptostreptococcaceae bacterium]
MHKKLISTCIVLLIGLIAIGCEKNDKKQINVSVASSLKDPLLKIEELYEKENKDVDLVLNFGSSGSLKQQIIQGAPCDIFISASKRYMDELKKDGYLLDDNYKNLVKNELVLVSNTKNIKSIEDLKNDEYKTIGLGEVNSVPVGQYADEVVTNKGVKNDIEDKFIYGKDAKEVLAWVLSGNVDAGFLYLSDTSHHKNLNKYNIDEKLHSPIIYPVGVIKNAGNLEEGISFDKYINSNESKKILKKYGYTF